MKIFSQILNSPENTPVFVLYLDTEATGNPEKDTSYSSMDFSLFNLDPNDILGHVIPMLSELVYHAYGETPDYVGKKEPLTKHSNTGFDPNYPNGVNTGVYDK